METIGLEDAVGILALAALSRERPMPSEWIATRLHRDGGRIRRLVLRLARARLVRVARGPGGGVRLERPPGSITLRDVRNAVFEQRPGTSGRPPHGSIGQAIGAVLERSYLDGEAVLARITIGDILARTEELDRARAAAACRARREAALARPGGRPLKRLRGSICDLEITDQP